MGLIYALVAAGLSLIFGLMDVVNCAHGELLMLAMFATFVLHQSLGLDPLLLLPLVALLLFGAGIAIYRLLIVRGLSVFIRGAAQLAFGGQFHSIGDGWLSNRTMALGGIYLPRPQVAASLVCLLAFALLLDRK